MSEFRAGYDVVIAGAGPAGLAAAASFASRGAEVLLLEAEPFAARRLAGEWLHPPGIETLARLDLLPEEVLADRPWGEGFVVFPEDGSAPIELPYAAGERGVACEHSVLVDAMRARMRGRVHYREGARVMGMSEGVVAFREGVQVHHVHAGLLVGADGKGSAIRASIRERDTPRAVSHMAGVLLEDVTLPAEGMGHLFVGGLGPALAYRIDARRVRLCLDVPAAHGRRGARDLYHAFAPALPASLLPAFSNALEARPIAWASNRLAARIEYGAGKVALVGDAVGVVHPLCAAGMTLGILDADCLAAADDVASYAKRREAESHIPELLSLALYEVLVRVDPSASAVRASMYRIFREDPRERVRTMNILSGREVRVSAFSSAFAHVAGAAALDARAHVAQGQGERFLTEARRLAPWARYPVRALAPRALRLRQRAEGVAIWPSSRPLSPPSEPLPFDSALARSAATPAPLDPIRVTAEARDLLDALRPGREDPSLLGLAHASLRLRDIAEGAPGVLSGAPRRALDGLGAQLDRLEEEEGGFGSLRRTASVLTALVAAGRSSVSALSRRAVEHLLAAQQEDGSFVEDGVERAQLTLEAFSALVAARCQDVGAVHRAARCVSDLAPLGASDALGRYFNWYYQCPPAPLARLRRGSDGGLVGPDWDACRAALLEVSRSFAKPIAMLPPPLEEAVTTGYLLCRIADTVEDAPHLDAATRDLHFGRLLDVLEGRELPSHFARGLDDLPGKPEELLLARRLDRVLYVLDAAPAPMAACVRRWAAEMVRGMSIYAHRGPSEDGLVAPAGIADLERYCYFVAGTVGHMLTELFLLYLGDAVPASAPTLREQAESFGIGLQLVNILKDITDDQERGVSYVPRSLALASGASLSDVTRDASRAASHALVAPLFDVARTHLDRALEYVLALPAEEPRLRLFCALPLWMAARTLVHARGNDAMFIPGRAVKISRDEVESLAADCIACVADDRRLRAGYEALWQQRRPRRRATSKEMST